MKTRSTTPAIAAISALTLFALNIANSNADAMGDTSSLIYNSRAYVQDIGYGPNPVTAKRVESAEIVFVDTAYGQAIYSYPSNTNNQVTAFNVEYVDTAYGPAIYSYPNHNPKHHLELANNTSNPPENFIVPVSLKVDSVSTSPDEIAH